MKKIDHLLAELIEARPDLPLGPGPSPREDPIISLWPSDIDIREKARDQDFLLAHHRPGTEWGSALARTLARAGVLPPPPTSLPEADPEAWTHFLASLRPFWTPASGTSFRIRCPLKSHRSRNPFAINLAKGTWFCYSCGFGGGVHDLEFKLLDLRKVARQAREKA